MIRFECDYATGAHPQVLRALVETNGAAVPGYGEDTYCEAARQTIRPGAGGHGTVYSRRDPG